MENKNPKNEKQKRSKAAKIVLWSILGCIGVMLIIILVNLIIGMAGGTGTQDGSILGLGFSSLFAILGFLLLALILAWLLTEPSFKKEEEVIIDNDRNSYVKKAKTPRPLADKTGVKAAEATETPAKETETATEETETPTEEAETPAEEVEEPAEKVEEDKKEDEKEEDEKEVPASDNKSDSKEENFKKKVTSESNEAKNEPVAEPVAPVADIADVADVAAAAEPVETVFVRYRRSYMSRLIQSDDDLKAAYTDIKNKLLSYKGVHDRISWDFESFNAGRKKLAKINVKGKTLTVNLALDPAQVDAKYYATNLSGKPKFSDVPTLMKVKSGRSVKYTLELIDKMMANEEIPANAFPSKETFDLAYRDNDALVKEGYIKAIYDKDVDPDGNYIAKEVDIEDFISK